MPDTYELLRVVEKISAAADGPAEEAVHYFCWLERLLGSATDGKPLDAVQRSARAKERVLVVRLTLLQYLSRIIVEPGSSV